MKDMSTNLSSLRPVPATVDGQRPGPSRADAVGVPFREELSALQRPTSQLPLSSTATERPLRFSNHAIDRMQARGISFSPIEMEKIEAAVQKAAAKGAKETLLLTDNSALIVSVKDSTVVTVMDKASLKQNVFTNIDSTVMI